MVSDPDESKVTDTATVAFSATVGTSDWMELSGAPGVEHPTPPPLPLTGS